MPVRSRSRVSISIRIDFESRAIVRNASSSASTPALITPPSRTLIGAVSEIVMAITLIASATGSSRWISERRSGPRSGSITPRKSSTAISESARVKHSLGVAVRNVTRAARRSRSAIAPSRWIIRSRTARERVSSSTASWRSKIASRFFSGRVIQARKVRAPIAERVVLTTFQSEVRGSRTSRLASVAASSWRKSLSLSTRSDRT